MIRWRNKHVDRKSTPWQCWPICTNERSTIIIVLYTYLVQLPVISITIAMVFIVDLVQCDGLFSFSSWLEILIFMRRRIDKNFLLQYQQFWDINLTLWDIPRNVVVHGRRWIVRRKHISKAPIVLPKLATVYYTLYTTP